ncbi:MAG: type II toxin-antitoxin system RelE/ParE family toxin [Minwuia sp.]|nr:type II toxin-antitoxin system RelE/ParE family toxin [Minwuia sp.]
MRIFKTVPFGRFARRNGIEDSALRDAAERASRGLVDADLGGGVVKQRVARKGQGRSGGFRTILLFRNGEIVFFAYGFAKKDRENIGKDELQAFRMLADQMLNFGDAEVQAAIRNHTIFEVENDG